MKYICIDHDAIDELISGRQLQSVDFEQGARFVEMLSGDREVFTVTGNIILTAKSNGLFLSMPGAWKKKRYLVIDCEQSGLFREIEKSETLTALQKTFRFCVKYWNGSRAYNSSEKMISGTSKTVLFPLGFSKSAGFRVVLEREPDPARMKKRDLTGNFILLYKSGYEGGQSETEQAPLVNLKRVLDELPQVYSAVDDKIALAETMVSSKASPVLTETSLSDSSFGTRAGAFLPLREWMQRLTLNQIGFVKAPYTATQRLIGAAGTGKTATLLIRSLVLCAHAQEEGRIFHAVFITHSEATKQSAIEILDVMNPHGFHTRVPNVDRVSLSVKTLASVCSDVLNQSIADTEFVDRDAQDSKIFQEMYIEQSLENARKHDLKSHAPHMSETFRDFMNNSSDTDLAPLFQHEISVQIKGRAGGSFDVYKECENLKYGLPVKNDADKGYVYVVFRNYEEQLRSAGQFDTDDVVISAIGQFDTPIWRRRRAREGYDFVAVDEVHLFNINELQVFHYITRDPREVAINFAIDKAQAVGDRGWSEVDVDGHSLLGAESIDVPYTAVFRSSSNIVDFSTSILKSGANLFSDFSNSLESSQSVLTADQDKLAQPILYHEASDDEAMIFDAFKRADVLQKATESAPWEVLVTALDQRLAKEIADFAEKNNKAVTVLDRRGDYLRVREASKSGHMIVGHADYVGGLEFNAVVIVGVDKGRVPLETSSVNSETRSFHKYVAHNRLYVAASRARLALELLGLAGRGPSDLLATSLDSGLVGRP